ncbi:MAG: type II secretion system protein [Methyloprofundus sp.]|nr:type II secretion system protein [Methyloprofundus sp.]
MDLSKQDMMGQKGFVLVQVLAVIGLLSFLFVLMTENLDSITDASEKARLELVSEAAHYSFESMALREMQRGSLEKSVSFEINDSIVNGSLYKSGLKVNINNVFYSDNWKELLKGLSSTLSVSSLWVEMLSESQPVLIPEELISRGFLSERDFNLLEAFITSLPSETSLDPFRADDLIMRVVLGDINADKLALAKLANSGGYFGADKAKALSALSATLDFSEIMEGWKSFFFIESEIDYFFVSSKVLTRGEDVSYQEVIYQYKPDEKRFISLKVSRENYFI